MCASQAASDLEMWIVAHWCPICSAGPSQRPRRTPYHPDRGVLAPESGANYGFVVLGNDI
jgi:hypothetical protein